MGNLAARICSSKHENQLPPEDLDFLQNNTKFSKKQIKDWHKAYLVCMLFYGKFVNWPDFLAGQSASCESLQKKEIYRPSVNKK